MLHALTGSFRRQARQIQAGFEAKHSAENLELLPGPGAGDLNALAATLATAPAGPFVLERGFWTHLAFSMPSQMSSTSDYQYAGHETFPCRYSWLPKAVRHVSQDAGILLRESDAMVKLGVGKNMVLSIKFWAVAAQVIAPIKGKASGHEVTPFGAELLLGDAALDPFLEDIQTLWLLHWKLSTAVEKPLFGWDFLLNRWQHPTLSSSAVVDAFLQEVATHTRPPIRSTLEQLFDVFVHTYLPTRGRKGEVREDNLDSPFVELQLLEQEGMRQGKNGGRAESLFRFRREAKPEISPALFAYCLNDYWGSRHPKENTLRLQDIATGYGSPGQIFKLPEEDIRNRLENLHSDTAGYFEYKDSATNPGVTRHQETGANCSLAQIYPSVAAK